jgi:DNA-binding MarR family transcriptional regulator
VDPYDEPVSTPSVTRADTPAVADDASCSEVTEDLGWSLGVLFRSLLKAANEAATDVPGGQRGHLVLAAVAGGGLGTQSALAQQLGVDRTVMTYLLDDLERAGVIERQPDPADRRARRVVITDAGRVVHRTLQARMARVAEHVLAGLEPDERSNFLSSLYRAAAQLAVADPPPGACTVAAEIEAEDAPAGAAGGRRTRRRT